MIGNWEIQHLDAPALCLELGLANLDASANLCRDMNNTALPATFHHAKIIMSLAYHGVELFLKYGIGRRNQGQCPAGHSLRRLKTRYERLNPDPETHFDVPFIPAYLGFTADEVRGMIQDEEPLDQYLRYHLDLKGQPWPGVDGFDSESYVSEVTALREMLKTISERVDGQQTPSEEWRAPPSEKTSAAERREVGERSENSGRVDACRETRGLSKPA